MMLILCGVVTTAPLVTTRAACSRHQLRHFACSLHFACLCTCQAMLQLVVELAARAGLVRVRALPGFSTFNCLAADVAGRGVMHGGQASASAAHLLN